MSPWLQVSSMARCTLWGFGCSCVVVGGWMDVGVGASYRGDVCMHIRTYTPLPTNSTKPQRTYMIMAAFIRSAAVPWITPLTACRSA